ncbi:Hypothetical protein PBC10988_27920 [Planctomycetales bacterium 10988]|nr:Hypothetical protein PBC10988_27920 [Planctomycetales bacterium 10988]
MNRRRPLSSRRFDQAGLTIWEIMLVLAIVAVMAAMAVPALEGPLATQRLRSGAETIRAAWVKARVEAMKSGEVLTFRYSPETSDFMLETFAPMSGGTNFAGLEMDATAGTSTAQPDATLPDGITFVESETMSDARSQYWTMQGETAEVAEAAPIFFYPDGTTSTASLWLGNERGHLIRLDIRGITGVVKVSDVLSEEER